MQGSLPSLFAVISPFKKPTTLEIKITETEMWKLPN